MAEMSRRRAALRAAALVWHLISGMTEALSHRLRRGTEWHQTAPGKAAINRWMQRLTRVLGLTVEAVQIPADTPALLVANHISWLDIIAIASVCPARFLAKDVVRQWPFIGPLMALSGTLFIRRDSITDLHATNQTLTHALSAGQRIAIFPEGTTTDGRDMKPFRPGLFEAARSAACEVQPVAVSYRRGGERDPLAPYIDDDAFVTHLWRILGASETCVHLHFCAPLLPSDAPRKAVAETSQAHIRAALNVRVHTREVGSPLGERVAGM
jgi:1-acyl-sn-glycerol-3-phosphate acyltransferase